MGELARRRPDVMWRRRNHCVASRAIYGNLKVVPRNSTVSAPAQAREHLLQKKMGELHGRI